MSLNLQVIMLLAVFTMLLLVGICCGLHAIFHRDGCCGHARASNDFPHMATSFEALASRSGSFFREDLLNDDEILRLWICWYCNFANYEMKTQCALCSQPKKEKLRAAGDKPSAVRPSSLLHRLSYATTAMSFSSSSSSSASASSSLSSLSSMPGSSSLHSGPPSSMSMASASPPPSHLYPGFMVHTPLEPLLESPSTNCSGITDLGTPPGSPSSDNGSAIMTAAGLKAPETTASPEPSTSTMFANISSGIYNSRERIRRRNEWVTIVDDATTKIVWTRNAEFVEYTTSNQSNSIEQRHPSALSPSSFSLSQFPSPSANSIEPILCATAFVSRHDHNIDTAVRNPYGPDYQQSPGLHDMIRIEAAEHADVYASVHETHPRSFSRGINPHALDPVRYQSFPEKHRWFMQETSAIRNARWDNPTITAGTEMTLLVPRGEGLLQATIEGLMNATRKQLHRSLRVQFMNEPGIDAGGIVREWFDLVVAEFINNNHGLFQFVKSSDGSVAYTINQNASIAVAEHLTQFRAFGRLLGKALLEGHLVPAPLTDVMFKHILSAPISFSDLQAIDAKIAHSLQLLWETPLTESEDDGEDDPYALDFSIYHTAMGTVDLKPNGRNIIVTEKNKKEYVTLFVQWHLANSVAEELGALVSGIYDVLPAHLLAPFDSHELRLLLCGSPGIDVDDWEEHAVVITKKQTHATTKLTQWFWKILRSLTLDEQGHILQFATGSSRVPIQGFKALTTSEGRLCPFTIHCLPKSECPHLRAFTCFNRVDLPIYKSEAELESAIRMLLQMEATGFSIQ
uniref:HECT-type E3 ubiquitin transferase n=1 Tax=Globisporangium ultimum (strain ATCC 200006 / CBS 805.95 / DAOM BR144) TaxID=431595 RepID=K3WL04_GLOUD